MDSDRNDDIDVPGMGDIMMAIVFICGMIFGGTLGFLIAAVLSMEDRDR